MIDPTPTPIPTPTPTRCRPILARKMNTQVKVDKIKIKKINKYEYEITNSNFNNALIYQTFTSDKDSLTLNNSRKAWYVPLSKWYFYEYEWNIKYRNGLPFTPTTVMTIDNKKYVFVINNTIKKKGNIIFQISTKDINYGKLNKIKTGQFEHVRFDIDYAVWPDRQTCTQAKGIPACDPTQCNSWLASNMTAAGLNNPCPVVNYIVSEFSSTCGDCCLLGGGSCIDEMTVDGSPLSGSDDPCDGGIFCWL
jgi:hypothetical protein